MENDNQLICKFEDDRAEEAFALEKEEIDIDEKLENAVRNSDASNKYKSKF